jgi:DNA (cytosine-5)-methyltransferase 1
MTLSDSLAAKGRYSKLKESFDSSIFNQNWYLADWKGQPAKSHRLAFADLFSGAGGLSVGFRAAGYEKIFSVEVNQYASETIRHNFPGSTHFEKPIEELTDAELLKLVRPGQLDVICGGPPCQGFSVAGHRRIDDPRNKMFLEFCRVVETCQPDFFVMENVPGILTMQKGEVYQAILDQFSEIGYPDTSVRILEAADYGVPQMRARAVFVGNRHGLKNPYPRPTHSRDSYVSIDLAIDDLMTWPRSAKTNHEWTAHSPAFEERISRVPPGGSLYETFRDAFKRQHIGVPSMAAKENHGGTHIHHRLNRVLSARELARLQCFPDDFYFSGGMKKAYWQIGNAVPCLLAEAVAGAVAHGAGLVQDSPPVARAISA